MRGAKHPENRRRRVGIIVTLVAVIAWSIFAYGARRDEAPEIELHRGTHPFISRHLDSQHANALPMTAGPRTEMPGEGRSR